MGEYCYGCRTNSKRCVRCRPPARQQVSTQTEGIFEFSLSKSLESGDLADVEILVDSCHFPGQRATFKAHKMILALQNDVFKAMFYGDFAKEDSILITDLHPEGVRGLLRYFYSGRLDVGNVHQAACTRTAAAKYLIPKLEERCLAFVNGCMKLDDVCPFLDYVLTMGEEGARAPARALIRKNSFGVISSARFKSSTLHTVRYVLRHATNVSESSVLQAVHSWALQQWLTPSSEGDELADVRVNVRAIMLPLFSELRFLALTATEFVEGPNTWGILTDSEARAILSNIVKERSMTMPDGFCKIRTART